MNEIQAYYRREERYEGLQIVFYGQDKKKEILGVIEEAQKKFEVTPNIMENCYKDEPNKCAYYIEFVDDYDKIAGDFFEDILCKLGIEKCSQ